MKPLNRFCYAFLHIFTFAILMHCYGLMQDRAIPYHTSELWFVCAIIMVNLYMGLMHLYRMFTYSYEPIESDIYEDFHG